MSAHVAWFPWDVQCAALQPPKQWDVALYAGSVILVFACSIQQTLKKQEESEAWLKRAVDDLVNMQQFLEKVCFLALLLLLTGVGSLFIVAA